jgi:predicted metal-dependent HD superfamily phosphohydrolase
MAPYRSTAVNERVGRSQFDALWRRHFAFPGSVAPAVVHADLCRRLGGADRRFHNLDHIRDCLRRFDEVAPLLTNPDAVEIAIWFHDAIYVPSDPENERLSTELFLAQSNGASPAFRRRVCGLILATRHQRPARSNDRRFIEDIDLAGFGASWEEFMRHGALLREEFAAQSDAQYHAGQVAFLRRLKQRRWFFSTDFYRERYERRAQDNLDRLLAMLTAQA